MGTATSAYRITIHCDRVDLHEFLPLKCRQYYCEIRTNNMWRTKATHGEILRLSLPLFTALVSLVVKYFLGTLSLGVGSCSPQGGQGCVLLSDARVEEVFRRKGGLAHGNDERTNLAQ